MNKEQLITTINTYLPELDTDKADEVSNSILEMHNNSVSSLAEHKTRILDEKKQVEKKFKNYQVDMESEKELLQKYSEIGDVDTFSKAVSLMKSGNDSRDIDKEIEDAIGVRTRGLIEESAQFKAAYEKSEEEKKLLQEKHVQQARKTKFDNEVTISAYKNKIDPKMINEYRYNMEQVFQEYDEESGRYIARDPVTNKLLFGRIDTLKQVDVDLYTRDHLLPEKPFYQINNVNPSMYSGKEVTSKPSEYFTMVGNKSKMTKKGMEYLAKLGEEGGNIDDFHKMKKQFEEKNRT